MPSKKTGVKWSESMTLSLIDHLDKYPGDRGWSTTDRAKRDALYEDAANMISAKHPQSPVTKKQVETKLSHLSHHRYQRRQDQPIRQLFNVGSQALKDAYISSLRQGAGIGIPNENIRNRSKGNQRSIRTHRSRARGRPKILKVANTVQSDESTDSESLSRSRYKRRRRLAHQMCVMTIQDSQNGSS